MIPGEIITKSDEIVLNKDSDALKIKVSNTGDRPSKLVATITFTKQTNFYLLTEIKQKE